MKSKTLFVFFIAAIFIIGCKTESSSPVAKNVLSGKDYFDGIFFMKGEYANRIPMIKKVDLYAGATLESMARANAFQNKLDSVINVKDPTYFSALSTAIQSNVRSSIDEQLTRGAKNLIIALNDIPELHKYFVQHTSDAVFNGVSDKSKIGSVINLSDSEKKESEHYLRTNQEAINAAVAVTDFYYFAEVAHNTVAVTVNAAAVADFVAALAIVVWKAKYLWNGETDAEDASATVANLNQFEGFQYEELVNQIALSE